MYIYWNVRCGGRAKKGVFLDIFEGETLKHLYTDTTPGMEGAVVDIHGENE